MRFVKQRQYGVNAICWLIIISILPVWFIVANAQTLIITPKVSNDYIPLFEGVTNGIKDIDGDAFALELMPKHVAGAIEQYSDRYDQIIALDRTIIDAVNAASPEMPWRGGVFTQPPALASTIKGISFNVKPAVILNEIAQLAPKIKTLHTVVNEREDPNFIGLATIEASRMGIKLSPRFVKTPKETAKAWFGIIKNIDRKKEAIWISNDDYLDDTKTFEFIVSSSWKEKILIVSSIPKHAARGIGLGFTPDFFKYGQRLAQSFDQDDMTIYGLGRDEVKTIANVRTLNHIGYRDLEKADQLYDVVLPQ